jgi:hypothetical protein
MSNKRIRSRWKKLVELLCLESLCLGQQIMCCHAFWEQTHKGLLKEGCGGEPFLQSSLPVK